MSLPKERMILGIILTIIGGTILITSLVFGIIKLANGRYEDINIFSARLTAQNKKINAGTFIANANESLSFWLKVPDRRIENRDFLLSVSIEDQNNQALATWMNNFSLGSLRNSSGFGQYYGLGTHYFHNDLVANLTYKIQGQWIAPYKGYLVIRKTRPLKIPTKHILCFTLGIIIIFSGVGIIIKNKKILQQCDNLEQYLKNGINRQKVQKK
ncbi:MAG: hypothetical protein ABIG64_04280 [Candidatus Omnitrophota bacterium]